MHMLSCAMEEKKIASGTCSKCVCVCVYVCVCVAEKIICSNEDNPRRCS